MRQRAAVVFAMIFMGCEPCRRDCSEYQEVHFEDSAGAALTPLELTDGPTVHRCTDTRTVACEGNTLTYLWSNS